MAGWTHSSGRCLVVLDDGDQEVSFHTAVVPTETDCRKSPETIPQYPFKIRIQVYPPYVHRHELYCEGWRRNLNKIILVGDEVESILVLNQQMLPYRFDFRHIDFDWPELMSPCDKHYEMVVQPAVNICSGKSTKLV